MKFLFIAGAILFLGSIVLIVKNYEKVDVERNGHVVKMRIENLPSSCIGTKIWYYVTYSYQGRMYDKHTNGDFCETHHVGELVDMRVLNGSKHILYPEESALSNLISFGILGLFGLILSITQLKDMLSYK